MTVVIVDTDLAEGSTYSGPKMLRYNTHIKSNSLYNTPPCFSIYILGLVLKQMIKEGGLEPVILKNDKKAALLYSVIDGTGFYKATAHPEHRSSMNVTFRLANEDLENRFIREAESIGMCGLKGHRSVGGIRASIYNAFPFEGVSKLVDFMKEFERKNG